MLGFGGLLATRGVWPLAAAWIALMSQLVAPAEPGRSSAPVRRG